MKEDFSENNTSTLGIGERLASRVDTGLRSYHTLMDLAGNLPQDPARHRRYRSCKNRPNYSI